MVKMLLCPVGVGFSAVTCIFLILQTGVSVAIYGNWTAKHSKAMINPY